MAFKRQGDAGSSTCPVGVGMCAKKHLAIVVRKRLLYLSFIYGLVKVCQWPLLDRKLEFWKHCPNPFLFYQAGLCWDHGRDLWLRKWKGSFKWCAQTCNPVIVGPLSHLSLSPHLSTGRRGELVILTARWPYASVILGNVSENIDFLSSKSEPWQIPW